MKAYSGAQWFMFTPKVGGSLLHGFNIGPRIYINETLGDEDQARTALHEAWHLVEAIDHPGCPGSCWPGIQTCIP